MKDFKIQQNKLFLTKKLLIYNETSHKTLTVIFFVGNVSDSAERSDLGDIEPVTESEQALTGEGRLPFSQPTVVGVINASNKQSWADV